MEGETESGAGASRAKVSVSAAEELIADLPAVESARILLNDWGGVREIHVLADASRPPKRIVSDVQAALSARWGLLVDHRRISVAQMGEVAARPKWIRLRLQQFAVTTDPVRGRSEVAVSLAPEQPKDLFGRPLHDPEIPDAVWQGRAAGSAGGGLALRLAAEATLQALNQSLRPQHVFSVGEVTRISLGDREVIVALVHYHAPRGVTETLTGSALVRADGTEAAVRCVLNATNRIYGVAMRRELEGERGETAAESAWVGEAAAGSEDAGSPEAEPPDAGDQA